MPPRKISTKRKGNPNPPEQVLIPQDVVVNPQGIDVLKKREVQDFGRDKYIKNLLKTLQPSAFTSEGPNVPKDLEKWIMSMEDYFDLAKYNTLAQAIMGRAKLKGPAKLWRKLSCKFCGIAKNTQGWEDLKERIKERYFPLTYSTDKMNEFLSCARKGRAIEVYYEDFVKLSRHAPLMSEEQKLSKFILGLEGTLTDEVESLRPTSLADALIRAKSKLSNLLRGHFTWDYKRNTPYYPHVPYKPPKAPFVPTSEQAKAPAFRPPASVKPVQVKALTITQSGKSIQCFECKEWGHKKYNCPKEKAPTRPPLPPQHKTFLNRKPSSQNRQALAGGYNRQFSIFEVQGNYEGGILVNGISCVLVDGILDFILFAKAGSCQAVGCKMKSPACGLSRHKTAGKGTMSHSKLELQDQTPPTNQLVTQSSPSKVEICFLVLATLEYPRLSKFCFSTEELHEENGLNLERKLQKDLSDKDIPDEEWLSVFKCLHKKNTKLFFNHVRDEIVDECWFLLQKVYQATPSNGELLAKFARGFVYERCPAATSDPIRHRIGWARFGGSVLENCKMQKGGFERKINKFRTDYGLTGVILIEASICDGALSSIPTMSASKLQPFQAVETPMYI
ncbi:hypothetical protein L7F22_029920 [Adiantum nelumboides]|nr:hypothetical protein [Adiantum nelumboides]